MLVLRKKQATLLLLVAVLLSLMVSFVPFGIPYTTNTKALVQPVRQFELSRNAQGNLITHTRDNRTGAVASYSIAEFRRGDAVQFNLRPALHDGRRVQAGDTLGALYSNEEQGRLVALSASLDVLQAELAFFSTGQKPEDVAFAEAELRLTAQELATQRKLTDRSEILIRDSIISQQEYDIAHNELKVKELAYQIAEARLASIQTGEKPEQVQLIESRIEATRRQLAQAQERINFFTLLAPFDGTVVMERGFTTSDLVLRIIDDSQYIGTAPLLLHDRDFFEAGNKVEVTSYGKSEGVKGEILRFDNASQQVNGKAVVFFTLAFEPGAATLVPGNLLDIKLTGSSLNPQAYLHKVFTTP